MFGVSRGRIISAIITTVVLIGLVAGVIAFVSRQDSQRAPRTSSQALASATATSGVTTQFTPAPGITVTISATPTKGSSSSATSYTGGAGRTTSTTPPRYPTPLPTSGASTGGGAGGGVTPTPTATSPTATPTPALKDDATVVTYSPTSLDVNGGANSASGYVAVNVTMLNTGSTTWDASSGYTIRCRQYCGQSWGLPNLLLSAAPGQSFTFPGEMYVSTGMVPYTITQSVWQMYSPHSGYFGQQVVIPVVVHGYYSVLEETSPTCENDGAVWTRVNSVGTVTCQSGDLALAQGGTGGLSMALTSIPSGYNYSSYMVKVHVHFTTTSPTTFAGVILSMPTSSNYNEEQVYMGSPGGIFCFSNLITLCPATQNLPVSSDYDITVVVSSASNFGATASPNGGSLEGGFSGGAATGLVELTASGSTDAAYFSNYQLYQFK